MNCDPNEINQRGVYVIEIRDGIKFSNNRVKYTIKINYIYIKKIN